MANEFVLLDLVWCAVSGTPGTGNVTIGAPKPGMRTPAVAGAVDGQSTIFMFRDGTAWEKSYVIFSASASVLARTLIDSSTGSLIDLTSAAEIEVTPLVEMILGGTQITPAQIAANQDNYNPTGFDRSSVIHLTSDAARNITGFAAPSPVRPAIKILVNDNAAFAITLSHQVTSTAANRIYGLNGVDTPLPFGSVSMMVYSPGLARWVVLYVNFMTQAAARVNVGLDNVTNDAQLKAADLDTDGTLAANSAAKIPAQSAVKTYVDTKDTAARAYSDTLVVGLIDDRGNYDASVNAFPASGGSGSAGAILKGDLWFISVAGTLGGAAVAIGDQVRALVDTPGQTAGNWAISEANIVDPTSYATKAANLSDLTAKYTAQDNLSVHGADIASAATLNLETATGIVVDVTGTTTVTAITLSDGHERVVRFTGILTLTHGASLVLPGAVNKVTAAGDFAVFRGYAAGVVRMQDYQRAVLATARADLGLTDGQIPGTGTNDSAAAGKVGEEISATLSTSTPVSLVTATAKTVTSITLTPGHWIVDTYIFYNPASSTTFREVVVSDSETTDALGPEIMDQGFPTGYTLGGFGFGINGRMKTYKVASGTPVVYLVAYANFAISTMTAAGKITARRVR